MCATIWSGTRVVWMENAALTAPAGTVNQPEASGKKNGWSESTETSVSGGTMPFIVTVQVAMLPAITGLGAQVNPITVALTDSSVAVLITPLYVAVMVTSVGTVPPMVLTGNVFVVAPAATVTVPCTVAAAPLLLLSVTTAPPTGAALVSVTVPVLPALPVTAVGLTLTPSRAAAAGFTV